MKKVYNNYKVLVLSDSDIKNRGAVSGNIELNSKEKTFVFVEDDEKKHTKKNPIIYDGRVVRVRKTVKGFRFTTDLTTENCMKDPKLRLFSKIMLDDLDHAFERIPEYVKSKKSMANC